jgi:molybdopterin synthase catalytic subunit
MPVIAAISDAPLSLDAHVAAVTNPAHGAIATFAGVVRDHDPSVTGTVTALEYSAHPDAAAVLERLASRAETEHGAVVAVTHRIGLLDVGELAIVVAASSAHRAQAFAACHGLVELVKAELPVWKREVLADGSHTWVGIA